jgi:hypothetical protein
MHAHRGSRRMRWRLALESPAWEAGLSPGAYGLKENSSVFCEIEAPGLNQDVSWMWLAVT